MANGIPGRYFCEALAPESLHLGLSNVTELLIVVSAESALHLIY